MNKDRIIGYITLTAIAVFLVVIAVLMWQKDRMGLNFVLVQFNEMGSLQNEDVVTIRGLTVGKIASIKRANNMALVEIKLDAPRILRKDSKFSNLSPNIMGSRSISIEPGTKGEIASRDYIFTGKFEPGAAEILYLADVAREQIALLMNFVYVLYMGDDKSPSVQSKFEDILSDCEKLTESLGSVMQSVEKQTSGAVRAANDYAKQIVHASNLVNETLDTIRVQTETGIIKINDAVLQLGTIINDFNSILEKFEKHPATVFFVEERELIDDLNNLVGVLQSFMKSIDKHGIVVYDENGKRKEMISFKNLHFIRDTARKKAKTRSEPLP